MRPQPGKGAAVLLNRLAALIAVGLFAGLSSAYAAFDLKPLPPAERGAATHLARSTPPGFSATADPDASDGMGLRALQVYGFKPFGLDEAAFVGASAAFALRRDIDLCFAYQALSVLSYIEQTCALSCSWKTGALRFEPTLRLGTVSLEHSITDHAFLPDIACYARLLPEVEVFFGARNPFAFGFARTGEKCPADITAGLGYHVSERFTFGVEVSKQAAFPTSIATGVEVRLVESVKLRSGIRTDPKEICLGLGLGLGQIALDMSASLHLDLGVTHEAGLTYRRK